MLFIIARKVHLSFSKSFYCSVVTKVDLRWLLILVEINNQIFLKGHMLCSTTVNVPTNNSIPTSRAGIQGYTVILLLAIMFCNAIEWAVLNKMTNLWTFIAFQTLIWSLAVTLPETFCMSKLLTTTSRVSPSGRRKIAFVRKQCFISINAVVVFFFFLVSCILRSINL